MFELKKLNVHRLVATEQEKIKLLKEGFIEVLQKVEQEVKEKRGKA
jgi:hypothetical protein